MFVFRGRRPVHIFVITFITVSLWTSSAVAQSRVVLTLAEAEDLALAGEPGQEALRARSEAMQELAVSAESLPDPVMRVGLANYPLDGGGFSDQDMTQAQIGVRQAFPRGRTRELSGQRLLADAAAFEHGADARGRDVLTAVRLSWLDVYHSQQAWSLIDESRPFFADLVTITRSMYAVGRKTQYDVLRAELELSRLEDRLLNAARERSEAQAALSRWVGDHASRPVAMKLPQWDTPPPVEQLKERIDTHPTMASADATISARQAAVDLADESKKPGWALDLGYGYRDGTTSGGEPRSDFINLAVVVDLPFFGKNRQDRKIAAALGERRAAIESRRALDVQLRSELDAEYVRWTELTRRLALYDSEILQKSRAQSQAALLAYQSDTGDFAAVMHAYIDDLDTRIEYLRLQVERARSYAVLANLGGLDE